MKINIDQPLEMFVDFENAARRERKKKSKLIFGNEYAKRFMAALNKEFAEYGKSDTIERILADFPSEMTKESWVAIHTFCQSKIRGWNATDAYLKFIRDDNGLEDIIRMNNNHYEEIKDVYESLTRTDSSDFDVVDDVVNRATEKAEPNKSKNVINVPPTVKIPVQPPRDSAQAQKIIEDAHRQAQELIRSAQLEADAIKLEAEEIKAKAVDEKAKADRESSRIILEARNKAAIIEENAEKQVNEIIEQANATGEQEYQRRVAEETSTVVKTRLASYMSDLQCEWRESNEESQRACDEIASLNSEARKELVTYTNGVQREFSTVLESATKSLETFRSEVYDYFRHWQENMYKREVQPLVNSYSSLNVIISRIERDLSEALSKSENEELIEMLEKYRKSLEKQRRSLERALGSLDLRVMAPQSGEIFDSTYHSLDSDFDDEDFDGRIIERCVAPGVYRTDGENRRVYQRCVVELRP